MLAQDMGDSLRSLWSRQLVANIAGHTGDVTFNVSADLEPAARQSSIWVSVPPTLARVIGTWLDTHVGRASNATLFNWILVVIVTGNNSGTLHGGALGIIEEVTKTLTKRARSHAQDGEANHSDAFRH